MQIVEYAFTLILRHTQNMTQDEYFSWVWLV